MSSCMNYRRAMKFGKGFQDDKGGMLARAAHLLRPRTLDQLRIHDLRPSLLALHIAPIWKLAGYDVPSQTSALLFRAAY